MVGCGRTYEPAPENRVYAFHSTDGGESWSQKESIYPEDGQAVYCTELMKEGNEITAFLTVHSGHFLDWKCFMMKSFDGGKTWGEYYKTDIPNPTNKPRLINLDGGRIALIHTPNNAGIENGGWALRFPLELWISDDDMKSWSEKIRLTDFPGTYSYSDGFYEDGHIHFVIEHNRHTILYFDVEL